VGAYIALSVTQGPALPLSALPLRLRKGGLEEASPHALREGAMPGGAGLVNPRSGGKGS
jgi:hypothetical protein